MGYLWWLSFVDANDYDLNNPRWKVDRYEDVALKKELMTREHELNTTLNPDAIHIERGTMIEQNEEEHHIEPRPISTGFSMRLLCGDLKKDALFSNLSFHEDIKLADSVVL
jgi:hypothetical protein